MRGLFSATVAALCLATSLAAPPAELEKRALASPLRIRLNPEGVRDSVDSDYQQWLVAKQASSTTTINGIKLTLAAASSVLRGSYWKIVYTRFLSSLGERVIAEGVTVDSTSAVPITLSIQGLPAGDHTLLTYHNAWDNLAAADAATLEITVDGKSAAIGVQQSIRKDNYWDSATSYVKFSVTSTSQTVQVVYTPSGGNNKVYLNGLEIDAPSSGQQVRFPEPPNRDERVDLSKGPSVPLSWKAPTNVTGAKYNVYFGTSPTSLSAVATAISTTSTTVEANAMDTFYWRVDVVSRCATHTGRVFMFRGAHLAFPGAEGWG